jgi:hypothetical protein
MLASALEEGGEELLRHLLAGCTARTVLSVFVGFYL